MKILVVEDDREAAEYLEKAFAEAGHTTHVAADGDSGFALADSGDYDVLVVDRMLPRRDGLSLIAGLRSRGNTTPVLILSALGAVDDRVTGLRAGGDDYLTKPYAFSELLARVEVLNRRAGAKDVETVYRTGDLELDRLSHVVKRGRPRDRAAAARVPPARISDAPCRPGGDPHHAARKCLGLSFRPADQRHRRPCLRLRGKIEKGFDGPVLHTVRGAGYMLKAG